MCIARSTVDLVCHGDRDWPMTLWRACARSQGESTTVQLSDGDALLEVACGTGGRLAFLRSAYGVEGLGLDPEMLEIARERLPGVPLHEVGLFTHEQYASAFEAAGLAIHGS